MTATRVSGPAGSLFVDDGGSGDTPVIFAHSFAGSSGHWLAQLSHLRPSRRAVAFDFRGHGESQAPTPPVYTVEALSEDIAAVADGLGIRRFVLAGHSLGAAVAVAYAGAHSQRVAGLLLVGPPGRIPPEQAEQILAAMESDYENVMRRYWRKLLIESRPQVKTHIKAEMESLPKEVALDLIRGSLQFDPLPSLRAYTGPKLAVVTPHSDAPEDLHNLVPSLPHKVIAGTSHWIQMDKPGTFNRILDTFLANVDKGRTETAARANAEGIRSLFERLGRALSAANAEDAAQCWETPALILGDEGANVLSRAENIEQMFRQTIEWYRSRELTTTKPEIERVARLSDTLMEVDVRWPAFDKTGVEKATESSRYIVHFTRGEPRIQVALTRTTLRRAA